MGIRLASLELRLARVRREQIAEREVAALRDALVAADAAMLDHLNPYELADRVGWEHERGLAIALAARDAEVLALRFNTLCVFCGAIGRRFEQAAAGPRDRFRCDICAADIEVRGGERIEAAFTLDPGVGTIEFDPFASTSAYRRRFVSGSIVPSAEFAAYLSRALRGQALIAPEASCSFVLPIASGSSVRAVSYDRHGEARVRGVGVSRVGAAEIVTSERGFDASRLDVNAGSLTITVRNVGRAPTGVLLLDGDTDAYHHAMATHPPIRKPFLTMKELAAQRIVAPT